MQTIVIIYSLKIFVESSKAFDSVRILLLREMVHNMYKKVHKRKYSINQKLLDKNYTKLNLLPLQTQ